MRSQWPGNGSVSPQLLVWHPGIKEGADITGPVGRSPILLEYDVRLAVFYLQCHKQLKHVEVHMACHRFSTKKNGPTVLLWIKLHQTLTFGRHQNETYMERTAAVCASFYAQLNVEFGVRYWHDGWITLGFCGRQHICVQHPPLLFRAFFHHAVLEHCPSPQISSSMHTDLFESVVPYQTLYGIVIAPG